ncbi:hypothetical protein ACFX2G_009119 [Malus domestica]
MLEDEFDWEAYGVAAFGPPSWSPDHRSFKTFVEITKSTSRKRDIRTLHSGYHFDGTSRNYLKDGTSRLRFWSGGKAFASCKLLKILASINSSKHSTFLLHGFCCLIRLVLIIG